MGKSNQDSEKLKAIILLHAMKLRTEFESGHKPIVFGVSLKTLLLDVERELSNRSLDTKKLSQNAHGIFRLVTESSELETSSFGKDLIILHREIRNFISLIEAK